MAFINYVDKIGMAFFYKQIKRKIAESAMGIVDITYETEIPTMEETGVALYFIDKANTTITTDNTNCKKLPTDITGDNVFIMNQCKKASNNDIINSYILFDEKNIYTGNISSLGAASVWNKVSDPSEFTIELTQAQYDALSNDEKNNGKTYLITDGIPGEYLSETTELAERAIQDENGNDITRTYLKKVEFKENEFIKIEEQPNAGFHNSIFRGKDITSKYLDGSLYTSISNGTFDDLYIGDYFIANINGSDVRCRIAGFDMYLNQGDSKYVILKKHHAVIVPDIAPWSGDRMNITATTEGGYANSHMNTVTINNIHSDLSDVFEDHLIDRYFYISSEVDSARSFSNPMNTGIASAVVFSMNSVFLLNDIEVFGVPIGSSSSYDILCSTQLPLFRLKPQFINYNEYAWWLRSINGSNYFATVSEYGHINVKDPSTGQAMDTRCAWLIG